MFEIVKEQFRKFPNKNIKIPARATYCSAGYDFFAPADIFIPAKGTSELIFTDICVKLENNQFLQLVPRSSIGIKKGLMLCNTLGIIDADYINNPTNGGNIGFKLYNYSNEDVVIKEGEAVIQGIVLQYNIFADEITPVKERTGGFGSSNKG